MKQQRPNHVPWYDTSHLKPAAFRGEAALGLKQIIITHFYIHYYPLGHYFSSLWRVMILLLRHYYVIITSLLHHYYSNNGAIISVIMGLLLPIITKSIMGNNESIITHYEPTQLADVQRKSIWTSFRTSLEAQARCLPPSTETSNFLRRVRKTIRLKGSKPRRRLLPPKSETQVKRLQKVIS